MPADDGERTEAPTPRRLSEAREHGQIARSADLTAALGLLGGLLFLQWFGPRMVAAMVDLMRDAFGERDAASVGKIDVVVVIGSLLVTLLAAAGPFLLAMMVLAASSNLLQVGWLFTWEPLTPKLTKLNPINGFGRIFSMRTLVQLAINFLKLLVVGAVAWSAIHDRIGALLAAMDVGDNSRIVLFATIVFDVGIRMALALLVIALIDYAWQKWRHIRDLRMTKQEVKEEMRSMEGDPIIKQRRRRMQMAATLQKIRSAVPKADVVVTNPTELAIAIQYDQDSMAAPRVVAKGQGYLAAKIREVAALHRVPIIERKPLAQALYKTVEVGQEIPEQFYKAIAEILAYVYELSGKARKARGGKAA